MGTNHKRIISGLYNAFKVLGYCFIFFLIQIIVLLGFELFEGEEFLEFHKGLIAFVSFFIICLAGVFFIKKERERLLSKTEETLATNLNTDVSDKNEIDVGNRLRTIEICNDFAPKPQLIVLLIFVSLGLLGISDSIIISMGFFAQFNKTIANMLQQYNGKMDTMLVMDNIFCLDKILVWIATVFLAPIAEEMFFRGLIFGLLRKHNGPWMAMFLVSFIFAIAHMDVIQAIYAFIAGMGLCIVYYYTGTIFSSIFVHMVFNLVGGCLVDILKTLQVSESTFNAIINITTLMSVLMIIPMIVIMFYIKKHKFELIKLPGNLSVGNN